MGIKINRQNCMVLTKSLAKIFYTKFYKIKSVDLLKTENIRNIHQTEQKKRISIQLNSVRSKDKREKKQRETNTHRNCITQMECEKYTKRRRARDDKAARDIRRRKSSTLFPIDVKICRIPISSHSMDRQCIALVFHDRQQDGNENEMQEQRLYWP